ncbi:MAG TPA: DEAD/DEAH box helicase, partial [Longimicrobiales bacterium]
MQFADFGLDPAFARAVEEMGFEVPTPIQRESIPPALEGRDVLACAMTGSGKTAAFLLPILQRLAQLPRGRTRALVLTPTRELAAQIHEHLTELARHTRVRSAAIFGGVGMRPQENAFRNGVDVLIATPGRLLDHLQYDYASLDTIEHLVLDEADRMLDMGFLPDVRRILARVPKQRQTLLFSATMPPEIASLSRDFMSNPLRVNVERKSVPAKGVTQAFYPVPRELKTDLLAHMLDHHDIEQALVFTRTKHRANRLAEQLLKRGFSVERIHGNRSQNQRTEALAGFKSGEIRVMVATDIVARGIDVEALGHVINYDVPNVPDDYIHRVGRTARAELTGEAYTFVSPDEEDDARRIERAIGQKVQRLKVEGFDYSARALEQLEVPLKDRIAAIRARKAEERARSAAKAEARARREGEESERRVRRGMPPAARGNGTSSNGNSSQAAADGAG